VRLLHSACGAGGVSQASVASYSAATNTHPTPTMTRRPPPSTPHRLPPGLVQAATAQAHALRKQAIGDAIGAVTGRLRRLFTRRNRRIGEGTSCLS
jgi:hypothetical protein